MPQTEVNVSIHPDPSLVHIELKPEDDDADNDDSNDDEAEFTDGNALADE